MYTGGILADYLQVTGLGGEECDISGGATLLDSFRVFFGDSFEEHYFSVVNSNEVQHLGGYGVNAIGIDRVKPDLQRWEISLALAYSARSSIALSCPPNFNTIIVSVMDETSDVLLFMGDAPAVSNSHVSANVRNKLDELGITKCSNVIWYQASHHGSGRNGEFEWLREVNNTAKNLGYVVFSNYPAHFQGIPNAEEIKKIFPSFFQGDGPYSQLVKMSMQELLPITVVDLFISLIYYQLTIILE